MARPIHADAAATRGRILARAGELFSRRGLGGTTMRQIAGAAEVSLATVHHYFGGKEELYQACIRAMFDDLEALRHELEPALLSGGELADLVGRAFDFARRHRLQLRLLMRTVTDRGELSPELREEVTLPYLRRGAELLAPPLGRPVDEVRLSLLSLNYLAIRYALNTDDELRRITGQPDKPRAVAQVTDHLVSVARALLED